MFLRRRSPSGRRNGDDNSVKKAFATGRNPHWGQLKQTVKLSGFEKQLKRLIVSKTFFKLNSRNIKITPNNSNLPQVSPPRSTGSASGDAFITGVPPVIRHNGRDRGGDEKRADAVFLPAGRTFRGENAQQYLFFFVAQQSPPRVGANVKYI